MSIDRKKDVKSTKKSKRSEFILPVIALRDTVVYPSMVVPLFVGRPQSIAALKEAQKKKKEILLVAQRDANKEHVDKDDLYEIGTLATVLQQISLPDGTIKVLVEGVFRVEVNYFKCLSKHILASVCYAHEFFLFAEGHKKVLMRTLLDRFSDYAKTNKKIRNETVNSVNAISDPGYLADTITAHLPVSHAEKQKVLEALNIQERIEKVLLLIERELDLVEVETRIKGRIKKRLEDTHRLVYLDEKMKAIEEERSSLGPLGAARSESDKLIDSIKKSGMSKEAKSKAIEEANKLKNMMAMSAEAGVIRAYIEWLLKLPWKQQSKISEDLKGAQRILDADHYGLEKVKERITEYLAVQLRVRKLKGPILCLVGPPGVGKTSLGRSIARATGRKFVRMSLGGVRDEAEIRGHRRTYIGAIPGKIIEKLTKVKSNNPVFMLDEIDKLAKDPYRGDPGSALLEVLDPEQNNQFNDHYIDVGFNLSKVVFIATANSLNIAPPLLDRMEVIRIPGYTEQEKMVIAKEYLLPKQMTEHKLSEDDMQLTDEGLQEILHHYTREAGVRELDRQIAKICRKVVKALQLAETTSPATSSAEPVEMLKEKTDTVTIDKPPFIIGANAVSGYLGVRRYRYGLAEKHSRVGQVYGLAWTEVGGELLTIEATVVPGKGRSVYTGRLGDVMQESIQAAVTVIRSRAEKLGLANDFYSKCDIHIHLPEGATPKDGPSAGIGICLAVISALTSAPVRPDIAMTGEITLRGEILPIGGLKEKLLAAHRSGIKTVIIPEENRKDLQEVPQEVLDKLTIRPLKWIDEVLSLALTRNPSLLAESPKEADQEKNKQALLSNKAEEIDSLSLIKSVEAPKLPEGDESTAH